MRMTKNLSRRFRRSLRAISPIIAVLLIIVITVAAALVAYAWVMGYLGFTTGRVGQAVQIQSIARDSSGMMWVYVQNIGNSDVDLTTVYVDDVIDYGASPIPYRLITSDTVEIALSEPNFADQVTIKVATADGYTMELLKVFRSSSGSGGSGGGATPAPPPTVTQISSTDTGFNGVQAGDLLVVMPNTRTGTFTTDSLTCTASGYTPAVVASFMEDTYDRRAVAVLIKVADGTESGTVSVNWGGSGVNTYTTIYQIYRGATTWASGDSGVAHNGGGSSSTSLPTISGLSSSTTANVLTIGTGVFRDSPGTVTMTNLGSQDSSVNNNCYTFTEFSYGDAVTETQITWTTARLASGLLVQIVCT